jgi:hypothetical protein
MGSRIPEYPRLRLDRGFVVQGAGWYDDTVDFRNVSGDLTSAATAKLPGEPFGLGNLELLQQGLAGRKHQFRIREEQIGRMSGS